MNKNKGFIGLGLILAIVLGIVVVGGGAYYLGKNSDNVPEIQQIKQTNSENKLFNFFDTFTIDRDIGTPRIEFMSPEQKLVLISYWLGQEEGSYAVYNYENNILYKNIGYNYMNKASYPLAFIGNDKLLMFSYLNDDLSNNIKGNIIVQDFNNKVIKTIMTDITIHEVYPKYGKVININTTTKEDGRFSFDSETMELIKKTQ